MKQILVSVRVNIDHNYFGHTKQSLIAVTKNKEKVKFNKVGCFVLKFVHPVLF